MILTSSQRWTFISQLPQKDKKNKHQFVRKTYVKIKNIHGAICHKI